MSTETQWRAEHERAKAEAKKYSSMATQSRRARTEFRKAGQWLDALRALDRINEYSALARSSKERAAEIKSRWQF